jgi:hypothetical protein
VFFVYYNINLLLCFFQDSKVSRLSKEYESAAKFHEKIPTKSTQTFQVRIVAASRQTRADINIGIPVFHDGLLACSDG